MFYNFRRAFHADILCNRRTASSQLATNSSKVAILRIQAMHFNNLFGRYSFRHISFILLRLGGLLCGFEILVGVGHRFIPTLFEIAAESLFL